MAVRLHHEIVSWLDLEILLNPFFKKSRQSDWSCQDNWEMEIVLGRLLQGGFHKAYSLAGIVRIIVSVASAGFGAEFERKEKEEDAKNLAYGI